MLDVALSLGKTADAIRGSTRRLAVDRVAPGASAIDAENNFDRSPSPELGLLATHGIGLRFISDRTLPVTGKKLVEVIVTDLAAYRRPDHRLPLHMVELADDMTTTRVAAKMALNTAAA